MVGTRLSAAELESLDAVRGPMNRAEYLRWLLIKDLRALKTPNTP